ncbi:malate dehydrogenase 2, cytoplasmic-like [Syzygium oleosum]|uniref:malate dehydrogenase 2, cytoplasmic-like n=1 Tax=Syzygium oleosum TaxID=219896 RepID=UPI0011D1BCC3|nr:malate dehydrogenase 2, cytoplasmic-like [Syzygium oleosum]
MAKQEPARVLVTDAGGLVAFDLVQHIGSGMLGPDQPMIVHLLHRETDDVEDLDDLKFIMTRYRLIKGIVATTDAEKACRNVEFAFLIGKVPSQTRTLRSHTYSFSDYKLQATALGNYAAANCKVLVIAYPADTIALTLKRCAPSIPPKNITCLTRLYYNCALGLISSTLDVPNRDVKNVIVWGNHSSPQHLDVNHATVKTSSGEYSVRELINNDAWLNGEFIAEFKKWVDISNGTGTIINASPIAKAACDHFRDWVLGTPEGKWVSMGVFSDGSYNVPRDLIFSFPVTCRNGEWTIVQGLPLDEFSRKKIDSTVEELMKQHLLNVASVEGYLHG